MAHDPHHRKLFAINSLQLQLAVIAVIIFGLFPFTVCLICNSSMAVSNNGYLEHQEKHLRTVHAGYDGDVSAPNATGLLLR